MKVRPYTLQVTVLTAKNRQTFFGNCLIIIQGANILIPEIFVIISKLAKRIQLIAIFFLFILLYIDIKFSFTY